MVDTVDDPTRLPLPLRTVPTALPADRAREAIMDANPWTYQVMAKEMLREGKIEARSPQPTRPT